jgi:hypothetical protein
MTIRRFRGKSPLLAAALFTVLGAPARAAELPPEVMRQIPSGYDVLANGSATFAGASRTFYIVALNRHADGDEPSPAPARPLLLFEQQANGGFVQTGRNDTVVMRADEGGQCDPFAPDDGGGGIAVKDRYFTIENGVACGQHWTDYITFRFDDLAGRYVFDNERLQSWSFNKSTNPDAEAMVPDGPPEVHRGDRKKPVPFENWRPSR